MDKHYAEHKEELVTTITSNIVEEVRLNFEGVDKTLALNLGQFCNEINVIVSAAHEWNGVVKREVLEYDIVPFIASPSDHWNAATMEVFEFERQRVPIPENQTVISPVSIGLTASAVLRRERLFEVQEKSQVLVEEWFIRNKRTLPTIPAEDENVQCSEDPETDEGERKRVALEVETRQQAETIVESDASSYIRTSTGERDEDTSCSER